MRINFGADRRSTVAPIIKKPPLAALAQRFFGGVHEAGPGFWSPANARGRAGKAGPALAQDLARKLAQVLVLCKRTGLRG